jgi:predicted DCC family thiol-disulfide oxidoreductase YuxK
MKKSTDTLYYDGSCAQCSGEMRLLMKLKNETLELVNIHELNGTSQVDSIDKNELLSVLHLQTDQGIWVKGLDANVRAWRHTHFGWLIMPLRWPVIRKIADKVYYHWANKRACRLGYK